MNQQPAPATIKQFVALFRNLPLSVMRREVERARIEVALEDADGNQCKAARALGMHRNTLARRMVELAIASDYGKARRKQPRSVRDLRRQIWGAA